MYCIDDVNFQEKQTLGEISKELKVIKKELDSLEVNRSTKLST